MKIILLTLIILFNFNIFAATEDNSRLAVHLLDYLASDYGGAVNGGKVTSLSEYEEQQEFVNKIDKIIHETKNKELIEKSAKLKLFIKQKKDAGDVSFLARSIQRDLITFAKMTIAPESWPDIKRGKEIFAKNCISCHGLTGLGDGPDGKKLDPKPSNFHNLERMNTISAFHCYNTIRLGVPGTGMIAHDNLDDRQIWDLAFYVMSIPFSDKANLSSSNNDPIIPLRDVSMLSNIEISEKIKNKDAAVTIFESIQDGPGLGRCSWWLQQRIVVVRLTIREVHDWLI
jgi:high-affinity iron transporter